MTTSLMLKAWFVNHRVALTNQVVLILYFSNILSRRLTPIVPAKRPGDFPSTFYVNMRFDVSGRLTPRDVTSSSLVHSLQFDGDGDGLF